MNVTALKELLDACFLAKRIVETLPELPKNMKPRHIHVLSVVFEMQGKQGMCRVSDVSGRLSITMPSVTRLVQELAQYGMLEKQPDMEDRRITLLTLTEQGRACVQRYVIQFHEMWSDALSDITNEEAEDAVHVVKELWRTLPHREKSLRENAGGAHGRMSEE